VPKVAQRTPALAPNRAGVTDSMPLMWFWPGTSNTGEGGGGRVA